MLLAASASPSPTMVWWALDADDRDCAETTALADEGPSNSIVRRLRTTRCGRAPETRQATTPRRSAIRSCSMMNPAEATAPAVPGIIDAGEAFQMAASLNDNLSIRDYYVTTDYELAND